MNRSVAPTAQVSAAAQAPTDRGRAPPVPSVRRAFACRTGGIDCGDAQDDRGRQVTRTDR